MKDAVNCHSLSVSTTVSQNSHHTLQLSSRIGERLVKRCEAADFYIKMISPFCLLHIMMI